MTNSPTKSLSAYAQEVDQTAAIHRKLQEEIDAIDRRNATAEKQKKTESDVEEEFEPAVQAGEREQPELPYGVQHQAKPGIEAQLDPRPEFMAPTYRGSDKLKDMVAIITGGDSGIGRAVAVLFAREGADVAIVYLNEHEDALETKRCVENEGRKCLTMTGDVRNADFCKAAVEETVAQFGKLDVLVNNAAFQLHAADIADITEEHLDMTFRTNIYGYFHMVKAALPHLKSGSSIINTGSETGFFGSEQLLDYSSTKGAIHAFTKALATNLVSKGIRVNAVAPGPVWTPLNPADRPAEKVAEFGKTTDMKRAAQPEEVSPAYVFLAAPVCSSFITGVVLPVMGGVKG
jgi:NAD(P)-dependent dehydrogenase (short-subunit alcohol dehydrogenase family)